MWLELADQLRDETLTLIAQKDGIYEFYHSETGKPGEREQYRCSTGLLQCSLISSCKSQMR